MRFERAGVVLVLFPDSNPTTAKRRPAVVVQANDLRSGLAQAIMAMISSNPARAGHPSCVTVTRASREGRPMGLLTDSVTMADNLATVLDREVERVIGHCPALALVDAALRHTLAL